MANELKGAFEIIFSLEREFLSAVGLSLKVSLIALFLAAIIAIPFGIWVGTGKFKHRELTSAILNTAMSFPTVVIGLLLYSFFSRKGPMGNLGILFTPAAMITGQCILAFPIIAALVAAGTRNLGDRAILAARALGAGNIKSILLFLKESRLIVLASLSAAFGRIFSEVGISMMLGGNIRFYTRNITTAIALETSKGAFSLGIALGMVLMVIAFTINASVYYLQPKKI
ncbi:MAG: ABC transporter permease [Omnitrophica bacterium]|nr:ABC transporter permease [Candidatus Omnitrophota bacterium]